MSSSRIKSPLKEKDVLCYKSNKESKSQSTVRRYYLRWRQQQIPSIPERCDIPKCVFHKNSLVWNGKPIKLILDHINGVNTDNRTKNLHLLCPNCDSQQLRTRGGANKNRVEKSTGGFSIKEKDGKKKYTLPAESADFSININDASLIYSKEKQE